MALVPSTTIKCKLSHGLRRVVDNTDRRRRDQTRDGQTQVDRQMEFNMTYETLALVEILEIILTVLSL